MSLIYRVGWVQTLEKYVTKFYVSNWEGRVGSDLNMYDVPLLEFVFFELFPKCNKRITAIKYMTKYDNI